MSPAVTFAQILEALERVDVAGLRDDVNMLRAYILSLRGQVDDDRAVEEG